VTYPANCTSGAPVSGDVFRACWEIAGRPKNMFDVRENTVGYVNRNGGIAVIGHTWGAPINLGCGTTIDSHPTAQTDHKKQLIKDLHFEAKDAKSA
jgi:hypothetical protein